MPVQSVPLTLPNDLQRAFRIRAAVLQNNNVRAKKGKVTNQKNPRQIDSWRKGLD